MFRWTAVLSLMGALLYAQPPAPSSGKLDFVAGDVSSGGFRPLPGVALTVVGPDGRTYPGVTGEDAHFRLLDLPPGVYSIRDIQAKGFAVDLVSGGGGPTYIQSGETWVANVPMNPLATIEGTVTGGDGKPIAGATVFLQAYGAQPLKRQPEFRDLAEAIKAADEREYEFKGSVATTQTDAQGRYRFEQSGEFFRPPLFSPLDRLGLAAALPGEDSPSTSTDFFVEFRESGRIVDLRLSAAQRAQ